MRKPATMRGLEDLGRVRLSPNFFMRDFLYSEIAATHGLSNTPDDPDLAIAAGRGLCTTLLEPLVARLGRISIRSAYRSREVNFYGNAHNLNCGSNESSYAGHIWDGLDAAGRMGATACVVVHAFLPHYEATGRWEALAWWVHDHLPHAGMEFFPKLCAFNLTWNEQPGGRILSYVPPRRGLLTKPGMASWDGPHAAEYAEWASTLGR